MIRIPAQQLFKKQSSKANNKLNNVVFVNDKMVNRKTEPTLYNVESARSTINNTTRVCSTIHEKKFSKANRDQNKLAHDTLFDMNISVVDLPIDFTLLETNSEDIMILNPNIVDMKGMKAVANKNVTAVDKFPNSNDPIYQLDEGNFSNVVYTKNQVGTVNVSNLNVSKVVSDIAVLNFGTEGTGINKYFRG